jgi:hypothetical protein
LRTLCFPFSLEKYPTLAASAVRGVLFEKQVGSKKYHSQHEVKANVAPQIAWAVL